MKNEAFKSAIDCAGGQSKLAKLIGTTQASVSRWEIPPAEYVLAIEKAVDGKVNRHQLRPDIYPQDHPQ